MLFSTNISKTMPLESTCQRCINATVATLTTAGGNRTSIGERNANGDIIRKGPDCRVLHPPVITGVNDNMNEVTFDALSRDVVTIIRSKIEEEISDLNISVILANMDNSFDNTVPVLGTATTRYMYDAFVCSRSQDSDSPRPPCASYSMALTTHESDLEKGQNSQIVHNFTYSDRFGRTIQTKSQTRTELVPQHILFNDKKQSIFTNHDVSPH